MSLISTFVIAIGLAMDAFAVSISNGLTIKTLKAKHIFAIALFFGFFQAIMPVIGWYTSNWATEYIKDYDHWVAFVLLGAIGCKMIHDALKKDDEPDAHSSSKFSLKMLLIMSIATSIDALIIGCSFACLNISILMPVIIIGTVTFVLSFIGVLLGNCYGHMCEKKFEILGGIILIGIGTKILAEHLHWI